MDDPFRMLFTIIPKYLAASGICSICLNILITVFIYTFLTAVTKKQLKQNLKEDIIKIDN